MCLGKAAGHTIRAFSKCVIEVTALSDVGRLGGKVLSNVMVKVAFISEGAFSIFLQGWKKSRLSQ